MNIAVAADGKKMDSSVSTQFEACHYLLIINMDSYDISVIANINSDLLCNEILKFDCEAVITGPINTAHFDVLADACITRYFGTGYSVQEALNLMEKHVLKIMKNPDGSDKCTGEHHH